MRLLDGDHWLPGARSDFLDGVEDDAVRMDRGIAGLSHWCKRNEREQDRAFQALCSPRKPEAASCEAGPVVGKKI